LISPCKSISYPMTRLTARLFIELNITNHHATINRLAHVFRRGYSYI
jgi:hypothetical protein